MTTAGFTTRTESLTADRLAELSEQPGNVVYKFSYETPEASMTPDEKIDALRTLCANFDAACEAYPKESDEALRERVLALREDLRLFQRLHNKLFACSTVRVLDAHMEAYVDMVRKVNMYGLMLRQKGEKSEDEIAAECQYIAMKLSMRDATPEELASATRIDDALEHAKAAGSTLDMSRLDRFALGPTTVHQGVKAW